MTCLPFVPPKRFFSKSLNSYLKHLLLRIEGNSASEGQKFAVPKMLKTSKAVKEVIPKTIKRVEVHKS